MQALKTTPTLTHPASEWIIPRLGQDLLWSMWVESPATYLHSCIAGHHTGLPDETSTDDLGGRSTLRYKLDSTQYPIAHAEAPWIELPKLTAPQEK